MRWGWIEWKFWVEKEENADKRQIKSCLKRRWRRISWVFSSGFSLRILPFLSLTVDFVRLNQQKNENLMSTRNRRMMMTISKEHVNLQRQKVYRAFSTHSLEGNIPFLIRSTLIEWIPFGYSIRIGNWVNQINSSVWVYRPSSKLVTLEEEQPRAFTDNEEKLMLNKQKVGIFLILLCVCFFCSR